MDRMDGMDGMLVRGTVGSAGSGGARLEASGVLEGSGGWYAFRLITAVHDNTQRVFTLRFLTHAEYSQDKWKKEL
jgi:hypothetical protein